MKNITTILIVFAIITFFACDNKNSDTTSTTTATSGSSSNYITCTINGKNFKSNELNDAGSFKLIVTFSGMDKAEKKSVNINFERDLAVTSTVIPFAFKMGDIPKGGVTFRDLDDSGNVIPNSGYEMPYGSITITKASKNNVEGTFEATSKTDTITNGKFAMEYTKVW